MVRQHGRCSSLERSMTRVVREAALILAWWSVLIAFLFACALIGGVGQA